MAWFETGRQFHCLFLYQGKSKLELDETNNISHNAQIKTIVGEVTDILIREDMLRPETVGQIPTNNSVEFENVHF